MHPRTLRNDNRSLLALAIALAALTAPATSQSSTNAGAARSRSVLRPRLLVEEPNRFERIGAVACAGSLTAFDIDRDGDQDILSAQDGELGIWVNDGGGGFRDESATRIGGLTASPSCFASADIDDDGDLDFVMGGDPANGLPDRLWINRGGAQNGTEGNFARDNSFPGGLGADALTTSVEFADADGDGDPDLLIARGQSSHGIGSGDDNELLINEGLFSGQFVSELRFKAGPWNELSGFVSTDTARWADVDGDTDLDIVFLNSDVGGNLNNFGHPNQLLLNDGQGRFTDVTLTNILPNWEDNTFDGELVDLDGDGDLDMLLANSVLSVPTAMSGDVLINQGGFQGGAEGAFLDDPTSFLEPFSTANGIRLSISAGDLDLDGDPDAFVTVHDLPGGGEHNVWINQGGAQGGTTGDMELLFGFDSYDSISADSLFVDVDGDGDLDVLQSHCGAAAGPGAPAAFTLYRNTSR